MKHYEIGNRYANYIDAFIDNEDVNFNLNTNEISILIFKHLFKIKATLWKQAVLMNRKKRISISDIFQDIIGLYLNLSLGKEYEVIFEMKVEKYQPDILIKYKGKNHFIIEAKTTIGWDRNLINGAIQNRILNLSNIFEIPQENIIYIFKSPYNINKSFVEIYWNEIERKAKPLPVESPFNQIRPLFTGTDPFYMVEKDFDRNNSYKEYSEEEIEKLAEEKIIIPLELTIKEIIEKANI